MKLPFLKRVEAEERFGEFGADVYAFNEHIGSDAIPYCISSRCAIQPFMLKRIGFMQEELSEMALAASKSSPDEIADAIVDLIYFAIGTAVLLNLPLRAIWGKVHDTNMQKVSGVSKRGIDGDAQKPNDFVAPNISSILDDDRNVAIAMCMDKVKE